MSTLKYCLLFVLIFNWSYCYDKSDDPVVNWKFGQIRGSYMTSFNGRLIRAFRGIPYAKSPIGHLRFKLPEKLTKMPSRIFDARKEGPMCIQFDLMTRKVVGQEDCLVLNVYTSQNLSSSQESAKKRPVMFYIHGGGFNFGTGSSKLYGPRRLLDHDVVLVTINYRLSVFGFLSTQNKASSGNMGLFDQVLALQWVQNNIDEFGGDSKRVTIFGESAGGVCVHYHLLSELSKGLFHAAISLSGPLSTSWGFDSEPTRVTEKYASMVGCVGATSQEIVDCLRFQPVDKLMEQLPELQKLYVFAFRPVVDGIFLTDVPNNLYNSGRVANRVPLVIGITKNEGSFMFDELYTNSNLDLSEDTINKITLQLLNIENVDLLGNVPRLIKNEYLQSIDETNKEMIRNKFIQIYGESLIDAPYYDTLEMCLKAGMNPFVYSFDYVTDHTVMKLFGVKKISSPTHIDDLFFLFDSQFFFPEDYTRSNDETENKFLKLWVNFAKYRDPTPGNDGGNVKWNKMTNHVEICHLDNPIRIEKWQFNQKMVRFWMKDVPNAMKPQRRINDEF